MPPADAPPPLPPAPPDGAAPPGQAGTGARVLVVVGRLLLAAALLAVAAVTGFLGLWALCVEGTWCGQSPSLLDGAVWLTIAGCCLGGALWAVTIVVDARRIGWFVLAGLGLAAAAGAAQLWA